MKPQTRTSSLLLVVLLTTFALLISACQFNVSRNDVGSLTVITSISQQELQSEISAAISDPLVKNVTVSLQNGYVLVNGERQRLNDSSKSDALSFRLDLGVNNDQLMATVSNAQLDGKPLEQNRVDNWNQTIANRLQKFSQRRQNTTLQSVTVTTEAVNMAFVVTKK